MPPSPQQPAVDALDLQLQLRRDLIVTPEATSGTPGYLVEDRLHGTFFRLGEAEYALVSYLDGDRTVRQAWESACRHETIGQVPMEAAANLARWLILNDLAQSPETASAQRLRAMDRKRRRDGIWQHCNPFFIRLPLFCPHRLVCRLEPWLSWLFSPWAVVAALILAAFALARVAMGWDRFVASLDGIFSPGRSLSLLACWLFLKILHEMAHGLVCRRYGGYVRSAGIVLILFVPVAFIDVTSSWRFRSKWQRIFTAAAGMHVELIIASLAAIAWSYTDGVWNQLCANCVIMASVTTVLFNANPLMRFDGYYILSDALEIPNLYGRGSLYLRSLAKRLLWGEHVVQPEEPLATSAFVRCYGLASWIWRVTVIVGLTVAAAQLFHGAGILLSLAGILLWFAWPVIRLVSYLVRGDGVRKPKRLRFLCVTGFGVATAALLLTLLPWPFAPMAPGIVEFAPLTIVRAGCSGFVREIHVSEGQRVHRGDILMVLENEPLQMEFEQVCLEVEKSRLLRQSHQRQQKMADFKSETSRLLALEKQQREIERQVNELTIRASTDGRLMRRRLETMLGTYLAEGDEVAALGAEAAKEICVSLAQDDAHGLAIGQVVSCRFAGVGRISNALSKIAPRASTVPLHPSFCATNGGPLPVQLTHDQSDAPLGDSLELLTPRIDAVAELTAEQSHKLHAGQRCQVLLAGHQPSVGVHLMRLLAKTARSIFDRHAPQG